MSEPISSGWPEDLSAEWQRAFGFVEACVGGRIVRAEPHERWRPAWFLDLERAGERVPIYFRGERGLADPGVYPLEHEMGVLQALEAAGIPVPHVYGFCEDPRGIVMAWSPGRANLATAESEAERESVLDHYVEILADMHRLDTKPFERLGLYLPSSAEELGLGDFPRWEKSYRERKNRPEPLIEFVIRWLRRNVPTGRSRPSFVAGDSGQFLFDRGRVTAVLDLELSYLGDPLADLAGMRCRDLSEPLGDLPRGFRRYAEVMGEEVDVAAVQYHTVRFSVVTPLAVAHLVAKPPPGLNMAQYLGWNLVYGRGPLEIIAELGGFELEAPKLPDPAAAGRNSAAFDSLVDLLEGGGTPKSRGYEMDTALRMAEYVRELDRRGDQLEAQDAEELADLLGRRLEDWREADAALEALILEAPPNRDAEIARYLYRRTLRGEALLRPALRELTDAKLQPVT